jgi:hypothetical protein
VLFAEFKRGVERVLSAEDVESHLNLGLAYREMGLCADAVREAAVALLAARDEATRKTALEMLLTEPLLQRGGLEVLRARLTTN